MSVTACDVPEASALDRRVVEAATFRDAYRAPLSRPEAGVVEIFHAIFGHRPAWMKAALATRNRLVAPFGIEVPKPEPAAPSATAGPYRVGDTIGGWPIFLLSDRELIAGRDNTHLDFRVSVLKEVAVDRAPHVVVSTVCSVHNLTGRIYLAGVVPFHKQGVQWLIAAALRAGRL